MAKREIKIYCVNTVWWSRNEPVWAKSKISNNVFFPFHSKNVNFFIIFLILFLWKKYFHFQKWWLNYLYSISSFISLVYYLYLGLQWGALLIFIYKKSKKELNNDGTYQNIASSLGQQNRYSVIRFEVCLATSTDDHMPLRSVPSLGIPLRQCSWYHRVVICRCRSITTILVVLSRETPFDFVIQWFQFDEKQNLNKFQLLSNSTLKLTLFQTFY